MIVVVVVVERVGRRDDDYLVVQDVHFDICMTDQFLYCNVRDCSAGWVHVEGRHGVKAGWASRRRFLVLNFLNFFSRQVDGRRNQASQDRRRERQFTTEGVFRHVR